MQQFVLASVYPWYTLGQLPERRAYSVDPNSITQKANDVAKTAVELTPLHGIDRNPTPIPGESLKQFKRRMATERRDIEKGVLTYEEQKAQYDQAFALFCDGMGDNKRPTITEVGMELGMNLAKLVQVSLDKNWESLRANKNVASDLAGNEHRLQIVRVIDRVLITKSEQIILKAAEAYQEIVEKICAEPIDEEESPQGEAIEPLDGLPIPRPGSSKRKVVMPGIMGAMKKTNALNAAIEGYLKMAEGAKNLGLIVMPEDQDNGNDRKPIKNGRLINLNLTLMQAKGLKTQEVNVTETG